MDSFLALLYDKVVQVHLLQALSKLWNQPLLQEALVCFSEKRYFPVTVWVLEVILATELVIVVRLFSGQS